MQTANIHIDKIRITAQWTHKPTGKPHYFDEGEFDIVIPSGSATANQKTLKDGGDKAYIKSKGIDEASVAHLIEIHCCPPLVLQGHNLFGHCVLQDYVYAILDLAAIRLGLPVDAAQREEWRNGDVSITEIHLTANFRCPRTALLLIIDAIDAAYTKGKWRSEPTSITVQGAKKRRSKSHALTVYDKAIQLASVFKTANGGRKPDAIKSLLMQEAEKGIRAEVKLYSEELKYLDLGRVSRWEGIDVTELYFRFLNKYRVAHSIQRLLTDDEIQVLTRGQRKIYTLWLNRVKLEDHYGRTSLWKYAAEIEDKVNIDIRGCRPDKLPPVETSAIFVPENILPVPTWAIGTEYYSPPCSAAPTKRGRGISNVPIPDGELDD
jgi:hypothetical protein